MRALWRVIWVVTEQHLTLLHAHLHVCDIHMRQTLNVHWLEHHGEQRRFGVYWNCHTGVICSDVPWLECPACNALTWVITVTE